MVRKNRLAARIRYAFDNIMSRGTIALIGWLAFFTVILVFIMSVAVHLLNAAPEGYNFINIVWMSLMRTFDAGNMGNDDQSWPNNWLLLLSMLVVTIGGIFLVSSLIGIITTTMDRYLEMMRKGRSRVIESGHTVILGWSEQVFTIIFSCFDIFGILVVHNTGNLMQRGFPDIMHEQNPAEFRQFNKVFLV